jgi:ADP-ribose pyrophosphatase YjhB (NUDIX family)
VGAGAVVHRRGRVLLVRRSFPPKWALPGGLVELGESASHAAAREVLEETGLRVSIEGLLAVDTDIHRDRASKIRFHYILVDYLARPTGGRVRLNAESSACGWFNWEEVVHMTMSSATRAVLKKYFESTSHSLR